MQTILITGGAGFIGSCLVRQLVRSGQYRVINLDKLTYAGSLDLIADVANHPNHVFIRGDIADQDLVVDILQQFEPCGIMNLAAESHVDRSIDGPADFVMTNVVGTFHLLAAARDYWLSLSPVKREAFRFLHVSTDEVYGSLGPEGQFTETTSYAPNSPYSASKAAADHFVRAWFHTYNLPTLITNCSNNYGPYQFPEKLIPLMVLNAMRGIELPVYGDGANVRDWLYVEDHCQALKLVFEQGTPGEVYNIGGNCERTNLSVVKTICKIVDRCCPGLPHAPSESLISFVRDRPGHDKRYAIDASKICRQLGWEPVETFESGLEKTVKWYIENKSYWTNRLKAS